MLILKMLLSIHCCNWTVLEDPKKPTISFNDASGKYTEEGT